MGFRWWWSTTALDPIITGLDSKLDDLLVAVRCLESTVNTLPTDADLQKALTDFSTAVLGAVTDAETRVKTDIDALKAQIAAGGTVTQADLDAVAAAQAAALAGIANIDPANPVPPSRKP